MKFAAQFAGVLLASCTMVAAMPQEVPKPAAKESADLSVSTGHQPAVNASELDELIHPREVWRRIRAALLLELSEKAIVDSATQLSKERTRKEVRTLLKEEPYWDAVHAQLVQNITTLACDNKREDFDRAIMGGEKPVVQLHDEIWHELWVITIAHQDGDLNQEKQAYHRVSQRVGDEKQWRTRRKNIVHRILLVAKRNCGWDHKEMEYQAETELRPDEEQGDAVGFVFFAAAVAGLSAL